jgi:lysyl-tRNA synthetase class 2
MPETSPESSHRLESQRRENRAAIAALGLGPYGQRTQGIVEAAAARALYSAEADADHQANSKNPGFQDRRATATIAGRVVLLRDNGKLIWLSLRDSSGDLQVAVSQRDCSELGFKLAKLTDLGDLVIATGRVMKTKTGEVTLWAGDLRPAAKSLVPPPEKHAGLTDVELRYRQRYVDLWANPETLRVFELRSRIVGEMRRWLDGQGFVEVETPMLQVLAGGAAARPFVTHMNALSINLYMRIAPELYLKRLMVGGMKRVYEINRNFRNEGLDKQHNPEFTMLELYEAYGDMGTVCDRTEGLVRHLAGFVGGQLTAHNSQLTSEGNRGGREEGSLKLPFGETMVDYGTPFDRVTYAALFERALGFPSSDSARARDEARKRHLVSAEAAAKLDDVLIINELFEEVAEKSIDPGKPTFITEYPAALSPLTRPKPGNPAVAERADLFIGHMELAPHYTELNDPDVQEAKFTEQLKGLDAEKGAEENTFRTMDHDFLRALKVGMPPAGGMGLGIDRLVMLLTDQRTIRDVVLFPLMRPEEGGGAS